MLTIDTREQIAGRLIEYLVEVGFTDFVRDMCRHGADYIIQTDSWEIGLQRKEISDFITSIDKLKSTMESGRDHFDVFGLLVEGSGDYRVDGLYRRESGWISLPEGARWKQRLGLRTLHNFCWSQSLRGSPVLYSHDVAETARLLTHIHAYDGPKINTESRSPPVAMLVQIPGIGQDTANALLEEYGCVESAMSNVDYWDAVDGIGEATVNSALEHVSQ